MDNLSEQIVRLEAVEEIRNLMADYTHYADVGWDGAGHNPAGVAALFTEDAVWDSGVGTKYTGRDAIRKAFEALDGNTEMSVHIAMNPRIDVRGDQAQGRWNGFIPVVKKGQGAAWVCGMYHCKFRRTAEGWKIAELGFKFAFYTPYEEGFGKTRFKGKPPAAGRPAG